MSSQRNKILGSIAGSGAVAVRGAAEALFSAAGKRLLDDGAREGLRRVMVENTTAVVDALAPGLSLGAQTTAKIIGDQGGTQAAAIVAQAGRHAGQAALTDGVSAAVAKGLAREAMRAAGREILKGAGKAAGIGFVIDGAFGAYEGVTAYQRGEMTRKEALAHAAQEASTGAMATGAGVLLAAGLVAVTGGAAAPLVFAVGAGGAIGAKQALRRLVGRVSSKVLARNVADEGQVG
ncbi:hypothetical protein predicted by Glimmer/Critica [Sorangium cellulosum So ce56]|uniref:Uncharacterized protein n=1 Tax=Sorangium cellulosum (strain So ce56) TaxID=448385 RepID=A9GKX1_SORC5|nr:hypothetical protein [Sorangium cellulosum]CAN90196.1 hypothetical protein predicted by Glimmer/Critica [Sorangium cellulosum So ce56]